MFPRYCTRTLRAHHGPVNQVQFNSTGNYCLSCGQDGTLKLWNPHRAEIAGSGTGALLVKTYAGFHHKGALSSAICEDNGKFASCGNDKNALLWDVATGKVIRKFWDHGGRVNCVALNSTTQGGESVLVTGCYDTCVRVFDLKSRNSRPIQTLDYGKDSITDLIVSDHQIIASDVHGFVNYYDIRHGKRLCDQLQAPVSSMALSHDGKCMLYCCLDSSLQLIEAASGDHMIDYKGTKDAMVVVVCCLRAIHLT